MEGNNALVVGGRDATVYACEYLESMDLYQKSDSVSRCLFSSRTLSLTFIPIPFEMTELRLFKKRPLKKNRKKNMSSKQYGISSYSPNKWNTNDGNA